MIRKYVNIRSYQKTVNCTSDFLAGEANQRDKMETILKIAKREISLLTDHKKDAYGVLQIFLLSRIQNSVLFVSNTIPENI